MEGGRQIGKVRGKEGRKEAKWEGLEVKIENWRQCR